MKNILLLDLDTDYVENIAGWAGLHVRSKVCLTILTNPCAAETTLNGTVQFDCVLITPSMLLAMRPVLALCSKWHVFLLDDGIIVPDSHMSTSNFKTISKYQSVRTIFEIILESTLSQKTESALSACTKNTETFFCMSAGVSSDEVPLAAAMAVLLSSWRRKVFYLDFEFGMSQNPFLNANDGNGMCDLLLHAKRTGQKEPQRISECTYFDPVSGVYTFRDGAGAFDHEDLDFDTITWILSEMKKASYYDDIVIHAGTRFDRHHAQLFWHADRSFLIYDGLQEARFLRCQKMRHSLFAERHSECETKLNLVPVVKDTSEVGMFSHSAENPNDMVTHAAIQSPKRGLNWMQDTAFLEGIASILLPQIQGGAKWNDKK